MSLLDIDQTKNELLAIFPQHNEATITRICLEIVNNLGVNSHELILPMCIEQLLELPGNDDNEHNNIDPEPYIHPRGINDPETVTEVKVNNSANWGDFVPGLNNSDSSNDGYNSPSSDEDDDTLKDNDNYRNKGRPVYRENRKESSESPKKKPSPDYLYDNDDLIFADIDDLDLGGFVKAQTKTNTPVSNVTVPKVITIKDSPLANRKRKMDLNNSFNPIDLTGLTNNNINIKRPAKYTNSDISSLISHVTPTNDILTEGLKDYHTPRSAISSTISAHVTPPNDILTKGLKDYHTPRSAISSSARKEHTTPLKTETLTNGTKYDHTPRSTTITAQKERTPPLKTIILMNGMTGYLEACKEQIKAIIDDVENTYLESLINLQPVPTTVPQVVQNIVGLLLDNKNYPKAVKVQSVNQNKSGPSKPTTSTSTITSISTSMNIFTYNQQAVILLQNSFPKVSTKVIRKVFNVHRNYEKSFDIIENALKTIISGCKKVEDTIIVSLLKGCRNKIRIPDLNETLSTEIKGMEKRKLDDIEKGDRVTAEALNNQQYDEEGQAIECGCCYCEVAFDDMIQCLEGHLFCTNCLQSYSKEAVYGAGKAQLFCMTDGCDSTFPMSQMKKALTGALLDKYMERVQDEDLKLANIDNLIKCPGCDFAAEIADGDKVFRCQNESCLKETCRYCKEEWKDHFGIPCKELEKKEVTNLRTTYEEKMTQAKVRECWQCKTIFLKSEGCNKMTCRCGAKMCYICRKPKISYEHFCQHPRNPGEGCKTCKQCNLWTDPSEDDDRAVAEIKKQAEEERMKVAAHDDTSKISIGPSISVTPRMPSSTSLNPRIPVLQRVQLVNNYEHNLQINNNLQRLNNLQQAFDRQLNNARYR